MRASWTASTRKGFIPPERRSEHVHELVVRQNLSALISFAHALEGLPVKPLADLGMVYAAAADLAIKLSKPDTALPYAIKSLVYAADAYARGGNTKLLFNAVGRIMAEGSESQKETARNQVTAYTDQHDITAFFPAEQELWIRVIGRLFPAPDPNARRVELRLKLHDALFLASHDAKIKANNALAWLMQASLLNRLRPSALTAETAGPKVEFIMSQAEAVLKGPDRWAEPIYLTFLICLDVFGFYETIGEAIMANTPRNESPIYDYLRISRLLPENPARAFAEMIRFQEANPRQGDNPIVAEMEELSSKTTRAFLDRRACRLSRAELPSFSSLEQRQLYSAPREQRAELMRLIREGRRAALARVAEFVRKKNLVTLKFEPAGSRDSFYLAIDPAADAVELYLPNSVDHRYVKVRFPLALDERGRLTEIRPVADFGQADVPFYWESLALKALRDPDHNDPALDRLFSEYDIAIERELRFLSASNLEQAFLARPKLQTLVDQLDSRLVIGRKMMGHMTARIRSGVYELQKEDFLYSLFTSVEIQENGGRYELLANARKGQPLKFNVIDWKDVEDVNWHADRNPLLTRYFAEMIMTAAIHLSLDTDQQHGGAWPVSGHLLEKKDVAGERKRRGHAADLLRLSQCVIMEQLRTRGLLSQEWFTKVARNGGEELFRPLDDNTLEGRSAAFKQIGPDRLFIKMEEMGWVRRLPIYPRRGPDGTIIATPQERHPERDEQKLWLGDDQPLPTYHALYVVTTFSDGYAHYRLCALRGTATEIAGEGLSASLQAEIAAGKFTKPEVLFRGTESALRHKLIDQLADGLTIVSQGPEIFPGIQTTYVRPPFSALVDLIAQGYMLELPHGVE